MRLLVRYGEIGVKSSPVKKKFKQRLMERLAEKLSYRGIDGDVVEQERRIFVEVEDEEAADVSIHLSRVPGVVSVSPVVMASLDLEDITEKAVELMSGVEGSFAVDARRAGEHEYTSKEIEDPVGERIVEELGLAVDLDDPGKTVSVEARYMNAYLYTETVDGIGGLPVNRDNRVAVLMEDRVSTVAAFLLMKRGCTVFPVYTGSDSSAVEPEMDLLQRFDPEVKLTVMDGSGVDALADAADLYGCQAVAVARTADEIWDGDIPESNQEILFPTAGMSEDEALERYSELIPADL